MIAGQMDASLYLDALRFRELLLQHQSGGPSLHVRDAAGEPLPAGDALVRVLDQAMAERDRANHEAKSGSG